MIKQVEIINSIRHTALSVAVAAAKMPNTNKKFTSFHKTYNRRPRNKQKRLQATVEMCLSSVFGAVELANIISQPTPRFDIGIMN